MVALYLAHEVEEEDFEPRSDLIRAAFGAAIVSVESIRLFMKKKEKLWRAMQYDVIVKREESDFVMKRVLKENYIWRRERSRTIACLPLANRRVQRFLTRRVEPASVSVSGSLGSE